MINTILSYVLYGMSGFFFGIFGSRLGILSFVRLRDYYRQNHKQDYRHILFALVSLIVLGVCWVIFPYYFYQKTSLGGAIYLGTLLYYFRLFRSRDRLSPTTKNKRKRS